MGFLDKQTTKADFFGGLLLPSEAWETIRLEFTQYNLYRPVPPFSYNALIKNIFSLSKH
ncbi:hypothetical protein R50076_04700 [Gilvimarinus japonicus]